MDTTLMLSSEGYVTVDGIEKFRHPMCAAPKGTVKLPQAFPTPFSAVQTVQYMEENQVKHLDTVLTTSIWLKH